MYSQNYTFEYVDRIAIPEDFICSICSAPIIEPIVHVSCANVFCRLCIQNNTWKCTICQTGEEPEFYKASKNLNNYLDKLLVRCLQCKTKIPRHEFHSHQCIQHDSPSEPIDSIIKQQLISQYQTMCDSMLELQQEIDSHLKDRLFIEKTLYASTQQLVELNEYRKSCADALKQAREQINRRRPVQEFLVAYSDALEFFSDGGYVEGSRVEFDNFRIHKIYWLDSLVVALIPYMGDTLRVWDVYQHKMFVSITTEDQVVNSAARMKQGSFVIAGSKSISICHSELLHKEIPRPATVVLVTNSGDIVAGGVRCSITIYDGNTLAPKRNFEDTAQINCLYQLDNGNLVSGTDISVNVWNIKGKRLLTLSSAIDAVLSITQIKDYVVCGCEEYNDNTAGSVNIWHKTGKFIKLIKCDLDYRRVSNAGDYAAGTGDGKLYIWDVPHGKLIKTFDLSYDNSVAAVYVPEKPQ